MAAAEELFLRNGMVSTGTRQIAAVAGVPERLIFRHFGSKRRLFEEVARALIAAFLDDFVREWRGHPSAEVGMRELTSQYVSAFLGFIQCHRRVFADLVSVQTECDPLPHEAGGGSPFADLLVGLEELAAGEARRRSLPDLWAKRNVRSTFSLLVGTALLADVVHPTGLSADDPEMVSQLTDFILGGALGPNNSA